MPSCVASEDNASCGPVPTTTGPGVHLAESSIREARKRRIARYLAFGRPVAEIAKKLGTNPTQVYRWINEDDTIREHLQRFASSADKAVEDTLIEGERKAALVLEELAEHATSEKVRLEAAVSLLDRAGKRGRPVERIDQRSLQFQVADSARAIRAALADPAVRAWLQTQPQIVQAIAALPPGESSDEPEPVPSPS